MSLGRQGKFIDGSLLSDRRRRVIIIYLQEASDAIVTKIEPGWTSHYNPEPRAVEKDTIIKENSVPVDSETNHNQEVMTGYENNAIDPTSDGDSVLMVLKLMKRLVLILNKSLPQTLKIDPQLFTSHHVWMILKSLPQMFCHIRRALSLNESCISRRLFVTHHHVLR